MLNINEDQIRKIGKVLNNNERPLKERFRALFTLRNIGGPIAIQNIENCFEDPSALLKHELAYCLGQMQDENAIPTLIKVLKNVQHEPMVRHEAAEALGAIGSKESISTLEQFLNDPMPEVKETCELALGRIKWLSENKNSSDQTSENPFLSVDPAPPSTSKDIAELKQILLNNDETLFNRYRAMFALRNLKTPDAILALSCGLKTGSALFRHEVAFVLGQLQDEVAIPALKEALQDQTENEMVRHECAEALGAIANDECFDVLNQYLKDSKRVVKESCEIALDMCEYENSPEFQYADTLTKIS